MVEKSKLPPQSIEAEENVLGALMVKSSSISTVAEILTPDMFYDPANAEIYACILESISILNFENGDTYSTNSIQVDKGKFESGEICYSLINYR